MRLRDMLSLINKVLPKLSSITFKTAGLSNGTQIYTINGINNYYDCISELKQISIFKADIDTLFSQYSFIITTQSTLNIDQNSFSSVNKIISNLKNKCVITRDILNQIVREQNANTISFKLYKFEDFSAYTKFCTELNTKILNPLKQLNIDVSLGELESGSDWISIIIATAFGVKLFAGIVRQAFDVLVNDYQKYKVVNNMISDLELGSELIKEFYEKMDDKRNKETDDRVESILSDMDGNPDYPNIDDAHKNEFKNSIKQSLELLSTHIDKGLEVYQALDLDEKDRYHLPNFTELIAAKQPPKLLTNVNENDIVKKENQNDDLE